MPSNPRSHLADSHSPTHARTLPTQHQGQFTHLADSCPPTHVRTLPTQHSIYPDVYKFNLISNIDSAILPIPQNISSPVPFAAFFSTETSQDDFQDSQRTAKLPAYCFRISAQRSLLGGLARVQRPCSESRQRAAVVDECTSGKAEW